MNPSIQLKATPSLLIIVALLGFALLPGAQAVVPPPDGGYPGFDTAEGQNALFSLTTGSANTAVGWSALKSNTAGSFNTGVGAGTLLFNVGDPDTVQGRENTAVGAGALLSNTLGTANTANGVFALFSNTWGGTNTAFGARALFSNTIGFANGAFGALTLANNTAGSGNVGVGDSALSSNTEGYNNVAIGFWSLRDNSQGSENVAIGDHALSSATGSNNSALGAFAGSNVTTASNVICIGTGGADVSDTTWIGNIYGVTTQSGTASPVVVSDTGQLGTVVSSERFKKDIAAMEKSSEAILSLRPVTFLYKTDTKGTPQFGLIAEEVAKVNPALVLPDKDGKPYSVRYDQVNAMLLSEFLKEHRKVETLEGTVASLVANGETAVRANSKGDRTARRSESVPWRT
jgi:Chaperone of endosialidase